MSEKSYIYGRSWFGIAFGLFLAVLFLYVLIAIGTKDIIVVVVIGCMILMALSFGIVMFAAIGKKVIIDDEGITYEEPLAKNLLGHKKRINSKWQELLEVKEFIMYGGHGVQIKTINGTFRITPGIQGYQDLMKEIRDNTPHLKQVLGSNLLHLVEKGELKQVRKRKLPLRTKIWIGFVSLMILSVYVFVAKSFYDFLMISLAWFYVGYLVQTKK